MTQIKTTDIPQRQRCINKEHPYTGGARDIFEDDLGKPQSQVNQERIEDVATLDGKIALEKQRAEGIESGLNNRLGTVEQLAEISIGGGDAQIATGADFTNPDATKRAKVPTVGAVLDGLNDGIYDVSKRNPSGGPNSDGKFTLEYILSNADTLIPTSWRHGGMSISFVQSSDNKYVQFRYMLQYENTTAGNAAFLNEANWAYMEGDVYVDNSEFIAVYLDGNKRIVKAIRKDGTEYLAVGLEAHGDISTDGADISVVENPEFSAVYLDGKNRVLFGIQKNANFYFGAGVPQQIIDYVEDRIADLSLDEYEDIVAFLNGIEEGDKTLAELLAEKVDKEEGRSLIDEDVADRVHFVENPEYIGVVVEADNKILEAHENDGTKVFETDVKVKGKVDTPSATINAVDNPEFMSVDVDGADKVLEGRRKDGTKVIYTDVEFEGKTTIGEAEVKGNLSLDGNVSVEGKATIKDFEVDAEAVHIKQVENPEYMDVELDGEDKVLGGRKADGTKFESVGFEAPNISVNGTEVKTIDDPENRMDLGLDGNKKIIYYRDEDGVLHENVGIETQCVETNSLKLSDDGMTEFQQALKDSGFTSGKGDWSDASSIEIPIPRCALVNITNDDGTAIWPTSKAGRDDYNPGVNCELHYYMEFYDMRGNYFKKEIIFSAQGNSSMQFPKKNGAVDICNNNGWDDDDTFKIKFGDWVTQDSFHFKAYYTNFLKGEPVVGYKLAEEIFKNRGVEKDTTWKQAILPQYDIASDSYNSNNINDITIQSGVGPKCYPDGFPAIFYLNGEFYGVYSWQIKKHRDNYFMDKSNPKHIHLDGEITAWTIFDGIIRWENFEIRNPKNLVYAAVHTDLSGKSTFKYDADITNGQDEIAGTDNNYEGDWTAGSYAIGKVVKHSDNYFINQVANNSNEPITADGSGNKNTAKDPDFKNKTGCGWINCTNTVKVKDYIKSFSTIKGEIHDAATELEKLEIYASRFDKDNFIDYTIFSLITANYDGFAKNWQWTTWDGNRWFVNPYDLDGILGDNFMGTFAEPATMTQSDDYRYLAHTGIYPIKYVTSYADTFAEMKATYKKLRDNGTISIEMFRSLIYDWCNRVGVDNLKKEYKKWTATPCNIDPVINEPWQITDDWSWGSNTYDPNTTYNEGDSCWYNRRKFIAGAQVTGVLPASVLGYRDSIYRLCKWFEERLELEDIYLEYSE